MSWLLPSIPDFFKTGIKGLGIGIPAAGMAGAYHPELYSNLPQQMEEIKKIWFETPEVPLFVLGMMAGGPRAVAGGVKRVRTAGERAAFETYGGEVSPGRKFAEVAAREIEQPPRTRPVVVKDV